jgi:hypothetical protein
MRITDTPPSSHAPTTSRRKQWPTLDEVLALMVATGAVLVRVPTSAGFQTIVGGTEVHGRTYQVLYQRRYIRMKTDAAGHIRGHYELSPLGAAHARSREAFRAATQNLQAVAEADAQASAARRSA